MAEEANITPDETVRENLETILSSINDGFFVLDRQWRYTYINNRQTEIMGMRRKDVLGKNIWDLFPDTIDTELYIQLHQAQAERTSVRFEYFYAACNRWFENRVDPLENGIAIFCIDITDRKQAEEELQEKQRFVQQLADMSPALLYLFDVVEQRNVYINRRSLELLGYPPETALAMRSDFITQAIQPDDRTKIAAHLERLSASTDGTFLEIEYRMQHQDGSWRWFSSCDTVFNRTPQGQVRQILGTAQDITDRKQAEEALRESEQRFQAFMNYSPASAWIADKDGRLLYLSPTYFRMFQFPQQDAVGKNIIDIYPAEFAKKFIENNHQVFQTKQVFETIEPAPRPDGSIGEFLVYKFPIIGSNGETLLAGVAVDITERRRTEAALKESEERFRRIFENSPIGVSIIDINGRLIQANKTYCEILEYSEQELRELTFADITHPEDMEAESGYIRQLFNREISSYKIEKRYFNKNGQIVWVNLTATAVFNLQGELLYGFAMVENITCRKRTEAALRESQELFQSFMNHSPIAAFIKDETGRYIYANSWVQRVYQRQSSELIGKTDFELLPVEIAQQFRTNDVNVLTSAQPLQILEKIAHEDGENYYMSFKFPVSNTSGRQLLAGVAIDVTDRIRAEEALRRREQELRSIADAVPALIAYVDTEKRYRFNNRSYEQWFAIPPSEIYGKYLWEIMGESAYEQIRPYVEQVLSGQSVSFENQIIYKNVGMRSVSVSYIPQFDRHGNVDGFVALVNDITDRIQVEQALREREQRFTTLFNGMEDWVLVYHLTADDRPGQLIEVNEQACQKLGYSREELLAMSVADIISSDAIDPKLSVQNLLHQKHIVVESLHITKDGQVIPVEVSATLFTLNNLPTVQAICRNISKRKQAENERDRLLARERTAREEAEAANRIKDEFLAVLSHELRSPLNPILGWATLLQKRKFDEETTARGLETIERNAKLQTQLIEDLLDVSRILRGKLVLNVAALNLVSTIAAAVETVQLAAEAKGIQIQTFLSANVGQVSGDATRLQQVVWNLLSNAVKFTPAGGRIEVRFQLDGNYAEITVSDTGKGIGREFLPYVFEYFRQEDGKITRKFGGLGLGLAIVRHITELHGGTVSVESPGEGLGATFTVRLPLYKQLDSTIDDKQGYSSSLPLDPSPLAKLRILVVDDEADMRELVRVILEQSGAEVRLAASAVEALAILLQYNPDVLISDIGMPETDGYMLMRQVRALPPDKGGEIPAIALTAYAGELNRQQALEAGFGRHISKPVEPEELVQAIAELGVRG
ncbi:PAS domain S-box protein [Aerosakkonema sp. BLCC-F183]